MRRPIRSIRVPVPAFTFGLIVALAGCKGAALDGQQEPAEPSPPARAEPEVAAAPEPAPAPALASEVAPEPVAEAAREPLEMTFVGDVIFGRYRADGYDPIPDPGYQPFADIAEQLSADVIVANLETPLVRDFPQKSPIASKYRFGASPTMAKLLADAGFTAVSLANNHAFDMRKTGMVETPAILKEIGVVPLGASVTEPPVFRVETIEKRGWRLGFIAVTARRNAPHREGAPELPFLNTRELGDTLTEVIRSGRASHELIIVLIHWGAEYADMPAKIQRSEAKRLIEAGADMVIGHHPHVLQGVERHEDGLIAYSMGNFLFENTNAIPKLTGVLRVRAKPPASAGGRACLERVVFHPAVITRLPTKHPVPATGGMGKRVRGRMSSLSEALGSELVQEGEDLVMSGWSCG
ncbi:MAG: CapA family protein [Myxococcales bacterium]|nr:CapA family protein [Myxococcales bacterium]MCB9750534.1 CapA family protein [Myxococcales bacterium]